MPREPIYAAPGKHFRLVQDRHLTGRTTWPEPILGRRMPTGKSMFRYANAKSEFLTLPDPL